MTRSRDYVIPAMGDADRVGFRVILSHLRDGVAMHSHDLVEDVQVTALEDLGEGPPDDGLVLLVRHWSSRSLRARSSPRC